MRPTDWTRRSIGAPCQVTDVSGCDCTTRLENAHRTALRKVLYRYHPWFGRHVCVHGTIDKADGVVSAALWIVFDRTAFPDYSNCG